MSSGTSANDKILEVSFHKFGLHRYLVRFQKMCLWDSKAAADFKPIIPVVHNLQVKTVYTCGQDDLG